MGFFDTPKIFTTHEQIKAALYKINTLDFKQREIVYEALMEKIGDGGISTQEFKDVIRHLRLENEISEIDNENLLKLIG